MNDVNTMIRKKIDEIITTKHKDISNNNKSIANDIIIAILMILFTFLSGLTGYIKFGVIFFIYFLIKVKDVICEVPNIREDKKEIKKLSNIDDKLEQLSIAQINRILKYLNFDIELPMQEDKKNNKKTKPNTSIAPMIQPEKKNTKIKKLYQK